MERTSPTVDENRWPASTNGGYGAVSAGRGGALRASNTEHGSGSGTVLQVDSAIQEWPLVSELSLAALPTAPACARGHVRSLAHEWGLADLADTAELLASELVTNAIQASARLKTLATPVVRIRVTSDRESLTVHVWDANEAVPIRHEAGPDDDGGRGLMIIDALSAAWGSYPDSTGKSVWATIIRKQAPGIP
jgi:anti-sigma regulatory factor (Ser/Thr protein kinase)